MLHLLQLLSNQGGQETLPQQSTAWKGSSASVALLLLPKLKAHYFIIALPQTYLPFK